MIKLRRRISQIAYGEVPQIPEGVVVTRSKVVEYKGNPLGAHFLFLYDGFDSSDQISIKCDCMIGCREIIHRPMDP